jgi:signal transduction histidine kinase
MVYKRIGDYDKAKAYLLPAYQDALRLKKGPLKDLLMNLGNTEEYLGNYKQSLAYYQRYLALTPADAFTQVLAYNNMGAIYMKLNEPQKAEALFHKAYAVEDTVKNIQGRAYSFYDFAWAAQAQNRCSEAIGYALKSLEEAKRYGVKSLEWLNYQLLSDCYNKTGNFQLANEYLGKYHVTKDSIYASQRLSKIGVLEATYRFEQESGKKQQEILSLQKENALKQLEVSNLLNKEKITQLQLANLANEKRLAQLQVSNLQQEDSLNRLKLENYNKAIVVNEMAVKNLRQQNEVKNLALSLQRRNQLLLGFGLFSLVGGFVLFYRYQRLRKRKELETIRATIAADFHDELGSTLSSIALSSEMALYSHGEADKQLKTVLSQISESSRNTVLAMKDMIWTIEPANDNLQEMIFRMKAYAFPLAEVKNMQLNLQVDEKIKSLNLSMEKRKNCYLVFKEALNNAFKYSGAENIIVTLNSEGEQLALLIRDNGKGFDLATVKGGNGLRNMQKRAKQSGGTLLIESKSEGGGTSIFFTCPLA